MAVTGQFSVAADIRAGHARKPNSPRTHWSPAGALGRDVVAVGWSARAARRLERRASGVGCLVAGSVHPVPRVNDAATGTAAEALLPAPVSEGRLRHPNHPRAWRVGSPSSRGLASPTREAGR